MTPYSDRGTERYKDGSLASLSAEAEVERYFANIGRPLYKYGLDGVPTEHAIVTTWTPEVRHTPDYLGFGRAYEVKSCWDSHVILKKEDMDYLARWQGYARMPVWLAIWRGKTKQVILADLASAVWACAQPATETVVLDAGTKGEKEAWKVPINLFVEEQLVVNAQEAAKVHPVPNNVATVWRD